MEVWMDVWMDGWMDGWCDGWMVVGMNEWMLNFSETNTCLGSTRIK
jgi:hypothetical protein